MRILWGSLEGWPSGRKPTPPVDRLTGAAFRTNVGRSIDRLEHELTKIDADDVTIEVDVHPRDCNRDGSPTSRAAVRNTPGVVLSFTRAGKYVEMPCDRYMTWQANVHALALTLEALRAVDRYGATTSGEQYAGWTALPAAGGTTTTLSTNQAAEMLATWAGDPHRWTADSIKKHVTHARDAWRVARTRSHPDSMDTGGSNEKFTWVQEAARIMAAHHGAEKL